MDPERLGSVIESLLLMSAEPLPQARVIELIQIEEPEVAASEVQEAVERLLATYEDPARPLGRGFRIESVGASLQLRTVPENAPFVRRMVAAKPQKLSRASLETLAVMAYRQPVTKPEVEAIRGVDSGAAIKTLLEHGLIRILGKREELGRPMIYGTTKTFLEFFGLRTLAELPTLREYHELDETHQREVDRRFEEPGKLADLAAAAQFLTEGSHDPDLDALEEAVVEADRARRAAETVLGRGASDDQADVGEEGADADPLPEAEPAHLGGAVMEHAADDRNAAEALDEGAGRPGAVGIGPGSVVGPVEVPLSDEVDRANAGRPSMVGAEEVSSPEAGDGSPTA